MNFFENFGFNCQNVAIIKVEMGSILVYKERRSDLRGKEIGCVGVVQLKQKCSEGEILVVSRKEYFDTGMALDLYVS